MSIKHKLLLIGGISGLAVGLLGIFLYLSVQSFNQALEKNKISHQVATYSFERRVILDEYLLHELERSKQQWFTVSGYLATYIESKNSSFSQKKEKILINNLIKNIDDNGKIFLKLVDINENKRKQEETIKKDQKTRLISQLLVKSQDIISITDQLSNISQEDAAVAQRTIIFLLIGFIVSFMSVITAIILLLWKSIVRPIAKLQEGTKIIASGNLGYKVNIQSRNEIGQLASSFNKMTRKLSMSLEEVEEEFQKFKLAFDNAAEHIIITNPEGIILYANKGAENTTGYAQKEMIGKKPSLWGDLMPKEFYERMWRTIKKEKKEFTGEITNKRKNGEKYQAQLKIAPIFDTSGKIKLFVGIERDITKEKEIDKAKTEFVLLASHQLRTPLTSINWYTQMLLEGEVGELNKKQKSYLHKMNDSGQSMVKLVNNLLDISHLELGMFVTNPASIDIIELTKKSLEEQKLELDKKKITLIKKFNKSIPKLWADPKLLGIVFQNLLSNAIKYTAEKGIIEFSIAQDKKKNVLIKISDTGYGIPKNQQDKIFTKLFRADNVKIKDTTGSGLGLYMVQSIIERTGGKIWFESEENKGTTFFITLPIKGIHEKIAPKPY